MSRRRIALPALIAGAALAGLGLTVAAPAGAHTNSVFTAGPAGATPVLGTLSRTDAAFAPLGEPTGLVGITSGLEVFNENGVGVGFSGLAAPFVFGWNHSTGEVGEATPITFPIETGVSFRLIELDTLADGTVLSLMQYNFVPEAPLQYEVVALDPATGVTETVVDIAAIVGDSASLSLATDPISGRTFLLLSSGSTLAYVEIDVADKTVGAPVLFDGEGFDAVFAGADFDSDGTLMIQRVVVGDGATLQLASLGAVSTWPETDATVIGDTAIGDLQGYAVTALTVEQYSADVVPNPGLAATGVGVTTGWLVAGGVAVVGGVLALTAITRRRRVSL